MSESILLQKNVLKEKRVCFISDTHLSSEQMESKLRASRIKFRNRRKIKSYEKIKNGVNLSYEQALKQIKNNEWDLIIHLGDVTNGYNKKEGSEHESAKMLGKKCIDDLKQICRNVRVCAGNHDIGYGKKELRLSSFQACQEIYGELFWEENLGNTAIIGLCSSLADYKGNDEKIIELKNKQKQFLTDAVAKSGKFVVCIHNPASLKNFESELNGSHENLELVVFGHLHRPSGHKIAKSTYSLKSRIIRKKNEFMVECLKKSVCCPSSAPLWWKGHSYMEAKFSDSTELKINFVENEKLNIPTASFIRCASWKLFNR